MTCREFTEFLDAYLSDELSDGERSVFEQHLGVCTQCVAYLDSYRRTVDLGREAFSRPDETLPANVPEDLVQGILAARRRNP